MDIHFVLIHHIYIPQYFLLNLMELDYLDHAHRFQDDMVIEDYFDYKVQLNHLNINEKKHNYHYG
jgi:hypothetical protein